MRKSGRSSSSKANGTNGSNAGGVLSPDSDQTSPHTNVEPQMTNAEVADIMSDVDMNASDDEGEDHDDMEVDNTAEGAGEGDDDAPMAEDGSPTEAHLAKSPASISTDPRERREEEPLSLLHSISI